jgi:hypothetical protein
VSATIAASPWTEGDRALMLAYRAYEDSLCPGCHHPRAEAWHPDNDGWYEADDPITCHACTAQARAVAESEKDFKPVEFLGSRYTRPAEQPLPPLNPAALA